MTEILTLPMLPLDDVVVLPGMVVPLSLSESEVRAAVEAAQASADPDGEARLLLVPRLDGKYASVGPSSAHMRAEARTEEQEREAAG